MLHAVFALALAAAQPPPPGAEGEAHLTLEPGQSPAPNPPGVTEEDGCGVYACLGPRTAFRLPDELPYWAYERQFRYPGPQRPGR